GCHGVAVRGGIGGAADAGDAAGAGDVLDDHRLAEDLLQRFGRDAGDDITAAAGRIGHDHRDRPARVFLSIAACRGQYECRGQGCYQPRYLEHLSLPLTFAWLVSWAVQMLPPVVLAAAMLRLRSPHGLSRIFPKLLRDSMKRCASAASFNAKVWLTGILM